MLPEMEGIEHLGFLKQRASATLVRSSGSMPTAFCSNFGAKHCPTCVIAILNACPTRRKEAEQEAAHLEQLIHDIHMPRCEADVDCGRELESVKVPAPLRHQVIDLVDVDAAVGGLEGDHAHLRPAHNTQAIYLGHSPLKLLCHLGASISKGSVMKAFTSSPPSMCSKKSKALCNIDSASSAT